jgi:hypothetical protein
MKQIHSKVTEIPRLIKKADEEERSHLQERGE